MSKEFTYIINGKSFILERNNITNHNYISACAALAFHKALIGVSELRALESVMHEKSAGGLRISRAVNTYYIVYHIFVSLMLLDENYQIKLPKKICENGKVNFGVKFDDLSNPSETPETWNEFGQMEQDLATKITHSEIKSYCESSRMSTRTLDEPHIVLYKYFIAIDNSTPNNSIPGLYEKLCYVRDRAIYRPSNVIDIDGGYIQTSKDAYKEIEELPNSTELFSIISEIFIEILKKWDIEGRNIYRTFVFHFWATFITEEKEYFYSRSFNDSELQNLKFGRNISGDEDNNIEFSSYVTQLVELMDKERLFSDIEELWGVLKNQTMEQGNASEWHY